MDTARLNRSRAALARLLAETAPTPEARQIYLDLSRECAELADGTRSDLTPAAGQAFRLVA